MEGHISAVAVDPEGAYVAVATADGTLSIYNVAKGYLREYHKRLGPRVGVAWHGREEWRGACVHGRLGGGQPRHRLLPLNPTCVLHKVGCVSRATTQTHDDAP